MLSFKPLRHFLRRDDGALTSFGVFLLIAMICVGGLAMDVGHAVTTRTHLQVAADSAAHAALMNREFYSESAAKAAAVRVAQASLPADKFGDTIRESDIQFGRWDAAGDRFVVIPGSVEAVMVSTQRLAARGNPLTMFFLRFVGLGSMDVVSQSVFETYYPTCYREGFVADERVDVQSNNIYRAGFCIHSNNHVELNSNNVLESGVIVSMPDKADLVLPASGFASNPGLAEAVRSGSYHIRILGRIGEIIAGYDDIASEHYRPDYFHLPIQSAPLASNAQVTAAEWRPWHVHRANCNGNQRLRIAAGETLRNGVIETDCRIVLGANVTLENVLILSESTDQRAIDGASGVTLGVDDGCDPGGGVQIVTRGGVRFTADLRMFGVQILAQDMIDFEANGNGVEGVSLVSGDEIDSTSNMDMGFCNGAGMENRFEAQYFRMVR